MKKEESMYHYLKRVLGYLNTRKYYVYYKYNLKRKDIWYVNVGVYKTS